MATLDECLAEHHGSKPPRTKIVGGLVFHRIAGFSSSYWIAERRDGKQALVRHNFRAVTYSAAVDGVNIGRRFRRDYTAIEAAAKALSTLPCGSPGEQG